MGLTRKSKRFLEILLLSGIDSLAFAANPKSLIYGSIGWSSDRNASRHLTSMSEKGLISLGDKRASGKWIAQLTNEGKQTILDDIDPERSWSQDWDGKWRSISFDLPQSYRRERNHLNNWLKKHRFGHLQGSLWITHRKYATWTNEIEELKIDPHSVLFQESSPIGRLTNEEYVSKAWPFKKINLNYSKHIQFLSNNLPASSQQPLSWFETESNLWNAAFEMDPFLPDELLPSRYKGKEAWSLRKTTFANWSRNLATNLHPSE
jgi:DNA-binding transcriptional regulator PaaX